MGANLNRFKGMEDQAGDFLKQRAAKLELVLLKCYVVSYFNITIAQPHAHLLASHAVVN